MSKFHEAIRDMLEDVQRFLVGTLHSEVLSASTLSHKEGLLIKLHHLRQEYPQLQLSTLPSVGIVDDKAGRLGDRPPSSPQPYLDMQKGNVGKMSPVMGTDYVYSDGAAEDYETFAEAQQTEVIPQDSKWADETEDAAAEEGYKELTAISAVSLARSVKSGYLEKKGKERLAGLISPFQRRWCAIKEGHLYYYERPTDRRQRGQITLAGYEARPSPSVTKDPAKQKSGFELVCPGRRSYQFIALTPKDMRQWIAAVERNSQISTTDAGESNGVTSADVGNTESEDQSVPNYAEDDDDIYETLEDERDGNRETDEVLYDEGESVAADEDVYADAETLTDVSTPRDPRDDTDFDPDEWYVGLWDCKADDSTELNFSRGDLIRVVSKEFDAYAWWIGILREKIGLVPKAYLMEAYEAIL